MPELFRLSKGQFSDTDIFVCDERHGPQASSSTFEFNEEQQELCLMTVNDSGRYVCKMNYEDLHLTSTLTVTDLTVQDKLGTPTVSVESTDPVKEGRRVNVTCSLDTKDPDSIRATFYNGTNLLNPDEKVQNYTSGNHIIFWTEYQVTRFDNRKEISCNVTDGHQNKTSANMTLDVQYYPRLECTTTAQLVVGRPAKINCTIDANPGVNSIVFPDELIETGWEPNGSTLSTRELKPPCSKTVTITATNNVGMGEASLLMDCWFEATISAKFNRSDNIFSCKAEGNPVPEISWDLLYENNTIQSYNSTASTLELSKRELQGVKAVTCRADQRQRRYFLPTNHQFTLEQNRSCDCGWNPMIPLVLVGRYQGIKK
ncbi:hypothetical protein Bbelb_259490 [Branchiostoma belcheri]|nr:hypothetical protein Bbelb_259490 [Branchiostoma belcheri]